MTKNILGFGTREELDAFLLGIDISTMEKAGLPLPASYKNILRIRREKILGSNSDPRKEFKASGFDRQNAVTRIFKRIS